jgi:hypothetical protein
MRHSISLCNGRIVAVPFAILSPNPLENWTTARLPSIRPMIHDASTFDPEIDVTCPHTSLPFAISSKEKCPDFSLIHDPSNGLAIAPPANVRNGTMAQALTVRLNAIYPA